MIHPAYEDKAHFVSPGYRLSDGDGVGMSYPDGYPFGTIVTCHNDEYFYDPELRIDGTHWMKFRNDGQFRDWTWTSINK